MIDKTVFLKGNGTQLVRQLRFIGFFFFKLLPTRLFVCFDAEDPRKYV
jgi:hypothetical protein